MHRYSSFSDLFTSIQLISVHKKAHNWWQYSISLQNLWHHSTSARHETNMALLCLMHCTQAWISRTCPILCYSENKGCTFPATRIFWTIKSPKFSVRYFPCMGDICLECYKKYAWTMEKLHVFWDGSLFCNRWLMIEHMHLSSWNLTLKCAVHLIGAWFSLVITGALSWCEPVL